jgi:hypothetical protein
MTMLDSLSFGNGWSVKQRANEPSVRRIALGGREVLVPSAGWQRVKSNGSVFVFGKEGLRTMRVNMNTHSDSFEMGRCQAIDEVWEFLQQYR